MSGSSTAYRRWRILIIPAALSAAARWSEVRRVEVQDPRIRRRVERTRPREAARRPMADRRTAPMVVPASYICEWKGEERGVEGFLVQELGEHQLPSFESHKRNPRFFSWRPKGEHSMAGVPRPAPWDAARSFSSDTAVRAISPSPRKNPTGFLATRKMK